jgi:lipoprotein-releasing system permease protein
VNVPFYIAKRHLFAKKKQNAVNVITSISIFVVAVVSAAMILILSAFNGIESLVVSFYASIEPDLSLEPATGKSMSISWLDSLSTHFPEEQFFPILKEDVIIRYDDNQTVGTVYAVNSAYLKAKGFQELLLDGLYSPSSFHGAFVGQGVKYQLQIPSSSVAYKPIAFLMPRKGKKISKLREQSFTTVPLNVAGVFSINAEYDSKYVFVPYQKLASSAGYQGVVSEIAVLTKGNSQAVKEKLQQFVSKEIVVKTRAEKNTLVYETSKSEKWFTFAILIFICCIAAFNIIASVAMLIIDKRQELRTFQSIGMSVKDITRIFLLEGMLINSIGIALGVGFGLLICYAQQKIGLVPMVGATVEYYPVLIKFEDIVLVSISVFTIGLFFTYLPVRFFRTKI